MKSKDQMSVIGRLLRIGVVVKAGTPHHPQYRLKQRWQAKIDQPKPAKPQPTTPSVTQVCREQWQGYRIHKIFGSARP